MKRLLAYLFLVLGLVLVVSVNANAKLICVKNKINNENKIVLIRFNNISSNTGGCIKKIYKHKNIELYELLEEKLYGNSDLGVIGKNHYNILIKPFKIAKVEPSQTQEVAKKQQSNQSDEAGFLKKILLNKPVFKTKKEKKIVKKTKKSWKCKLFGVCQAEEKTQQAEEKTQQVAKKIINIFCVKNNYSKVRMVKGEKPNCKNDEFNVVKNEYLLLETLYGSLESYFDLSDPNEVVLFERRVTDLFKIAHQDFNNLTETQQTAKIETTKKGFNLFKKEEKKITLKEVLDLGKYAEFNAYPEGMLKDFKQCKKQFCRGKIAGKKVYKIFAQRSEIWHQRHPGDIIHGMAWFEIFYLEKLRKTEKQIAKYVKNGPKGYSNEWKMKKDVNLLHGLIKTNKGRIKMRQALGLSLNDDLETVLKRHWLLGDFLNKDKLKIKKVKISSDIKKREALLAKYKSVVTRYKNKLGEERRAIN